MTSDEIIKYVERTFSFDCPRMVLRQNTISPNRTYEGPGSIYQTTDGDLKFKLYAGGARDQSVLARMFGPKSLKAGEIIPRQEYFLLEATAMNGGTWRGEFILPDFNQGAGDYGPIISGALHDLVKTMLDPHSTDQGSYLSLRFAEDFDFPSNTPTLTKRFLGGEEIGMSGDFTTAKFEAAGLMFQLDKNNGSVVLSAVSKGTEFPEHLEVRVREALEFTFFGDKQWIVRVTSESGRMTTTLRTFPKERPRKAPKPPIIFNSHLVGEDVWKLFAKYLGYVIAHRGAEWHPLSTAVHSAVVGNAGYLEPGLLALSVALEGVLKIGFPKLALPDDSLRDQIKAACKLVSDSGLEDSFKRRLSGTFGAMHAPRAKDKLLALVDAGLIRGELMDAWATIRNPSVHAAGLDPAAIDKIYRDYQSAQTLFNELVFLVIGYTGKYTDYSTTGWPLRDFEKTMKDHIEGNGDQVIAPVNGALKNGSI